MCDPYSPDLDEDIGYCHVHLRSIEYWGKDCVYDWNRLRDRFVLSALDQAMTKKRLSHPFDMIGRVGPASLPLEVFGVLCEIAEESREEAFIRIRHLLDGAFY
jgi:hypothetical protein